MDPEIIQKAILGDSEALTILIDRYKDIAYNIALSIIKNHEDAKDVTQDCFLKVLENISKFRNESKFSTWLYMIVYNHSIQFIQKSRSTNFINIETARKLNYSGGLVIKEEKYKKLYDSIDQLEDNEKNIILLFYLAERSVKEIGLITGLSNSNVKVILHRARKKLYTKLLLYNEKI